jgi:hypothetical protein
MKHNHLLCGWAVLASAVQGLMAVEQGCLECASLEAGFAQPPQEARPWTLWQWMNGNVSKAGITADLEAFKRAGLGGAQSFHLDYGLPQGPVEFNSPEWRDLYLFAAQEADRLGLQLGTHNCGGWSSSGGPWTLPENSMQVVVTREVRVKGPVPFSAVLPVPGSYLPPAHTNSYRDIAVLAYPTPPNESSTMGAAAPKITLNAGKGAKQPTLVGDLLTACTLPVPAGGAARYLQLAFPEPFTARQLVLTPAKHEQGFSGVLEASDDGVAFKPVRTFQLAGQPERQENPYQQIFVFPQVSARVFRISVEKKKAATKPVLLAEAGLSGRQTVDDLPGKAFNQRHAVPSKLAKKPAQEDGTVALSGIIDLSGRMDRTGRLTWDAPPGNWTVLRIGYQPNGTLNHPAPLGGEGLECDKLSKAAVDAHWAGMLGKLIEKFGPLAGKAFTKVEIDSWEVGSQNWTPKFREEFARRRGYDLIRFLPVFAGQTVESAEVTERFLWDFRRTVADLFAENYAGHMRELANKHHLELAVENYGTGPFDDLQYGGMADIPMGVHWMHNGSPQGCTLLAASAAHTYGRKIVGSEAFTAGESGGNRWDTDPYAMKRLGDLMYCSGVNKFIFHAATLQRWPHLAPGLTFGKVGSQFSRTATWWDNGGTAWFSYLARSQWMLQQGLPAADVCVLVSEGMPSPTYGGSLFPDLPPGYDFDLCSTDAFLHRLAFRNGRLVLPDGMSYRLLMLPSEPVMTPHVLRKIKELSAAGATIIGSKPVRSPSYSGYPGCDEEVRQLADELWRVRPDGGCGVSTQTAQSALATLNLPPDFQATGHRPQIAYKHRSTAEAEIYFVSNQKYHADEIEAAFRVSGKVPEIWDPETGVVQQAPLFREEGGRTVVPLRFGPAGSVFVVFRTPSGKKHLVASKVAPDQPVPPQTLQILKASYGYFPKKEWPGVADITGTKASSYKRIFTPERFSAGDPAPGLRKHMLAQYTVGGAFKSQAVPADGVLEMPQLPERFKMVRVLYGALTATPAAGDETVDVAAKLNSLVKDGALTVTVNKVLAGQAPVPAKPKELRVEYLYNGRWNIAFMPEGQLLELPGAYEAGTAAAAYELGWSAAGEVELRASVPGHYEFTWSDGRVVHTRVDRVAPPCEVTGAWQLAFPPNLGAPARATFDRLSSWTESAERGVKYFSGTATYAQSLDIPAALVAGGTALELDLGHVKNIAQVILNGKDLGVLWKPPFRVNISGAARAGANTLEVKVTNLWPNRLIGDAQMVPDREWTSTRNLAAWPQWLLDGKASPAGQITFTTAQHWQQDGFLLPSGLFGPVRLIPIEKRTLTGTK